MPPTIFGHKHMVAKINVPILSLKIITGGKRKKATEFSRFFAIYAVVLPEELCEAEMRQIYFRPGLRHGPRWGSSRRFPSLRWGE